MSPRHALFLALSLGCASTVAGTRGDAVDASTPDVTPSSNFELGVFLDLAVDATPGPDVAVLIAPRGGTPFEARTGADGVLRLSLDASRAYDVTAAMNDRVAVSLIGLRLPFRSHVRLPLSPPVEAPALVRATASVTIRGRSAPRSAVVLEGVTGSTVARDDTVTLSVPRWRGAPDDFWVAAMELDASSRITRGGFTPVASRASPGSVVVALDLAPRSDMSRVEFPFVGRVTPFTFGSAEPGSVIRFKQTELGETAVPVGTCTLDAPTPLGNAEWNITRFLPPLAPELTWVRYTTRDGALTGTVTMQQPFAGLIPAVPPVERLRADAVAPGRFTVTADTGTWSRAYFEITSSDGTPRWRGYAVDASPWDALALPSLPPSVTPSRIFGRAPVRARSCVVLDAPQMGQIPWVHTRPTLPFWARLSVCAASADVPPP
ncbi:MAG: hypothetical protein U0326_25315 [Polyangiales bacterium]